MANSWMYFDCKLLVIINGKQLTTIVKIKTSNDAAKVGSSCELTVPLNSYIAYADPNTLTDYLPSIRIDTFPQGCPVNITASYDGYPTLTIFKGFVYDFVLGMPATIKCMDYVYFFNLGIFGDKRVSTSNKKGKITDTGTGVNYKSIQFKDLLQQLVDFANQTIAQSTTGAVPVVLMLPTIDFELVNITFIRMSPAAILEYFKENLGLNITFYDNQLYVNLASKTNGVINLNTGINVHGSKLQTTFQGSTTVDNSTSSTTYQSAFQRIRLTCWFVRDDGTRDSLQVGDQNGTQQEFYFYNIKRNGNNYETLANAALLQTQQHHYRGELDLYLYPDCDLFFQVNYIDLRYPEKNGTYVITGVYFELDEKGFHRKIKVAWLAYISYVNAQGKLINGGQLVVN